MGPWPPTHSSQSISSWSCFLSGPLLMTKSKQTFPLKLSAGVFFRVHFKSKNHINTFLETRSLKIKDYTDRILCRYLRIVTDLLIDIRCHSNERVALWNVGARALGNPCISFSVIIFRSAVKLRSCNICNTTLARTFRGCFWYPQSSPSVPRYLCHHKGQWSGLLSFFCDCRAIKKRHASQYTFRLSEFRNPRQINR